MAAASLTGLLLSVSACNGADDDAVAATAISDAMLDGQDEGTVGDVLDLDRGEADCVGDGLVSSIGTATLQEYGFLDADLVSDVDMTSVVMSDEHARAATDTLFGCTDVVTKMHRGIAAAQSQARIVDSQTLGCLQAALTEEVLRVALTYAFSGRNDEAGQVLISPLMACAPPEIHRRLPDRPR